MPYPTYTVAGVRMDDPSGRWELLPDTSILPAFPGRRDSKWQIPGMAGNLVAAYAPGEAMNVTLKLRFNAVAETANTLVGGGTEARLKAIRDNIDLFFHSTALARSGYVGYVELRRYATATDYRVCAARVATASEPEMSANGNSATMTLIFEAPAGVWTDKDFTVVKATIPKAGTVTRIEVPAGTAPAVDNFVAIKGPMLSAYGNRLVVSNGHGQGFKIGLKSAQVAWDTNLWMVVNCLNWRFGYTYAATAADIDWACSKPNTGLIEPTGRPMGTALPILPQAESGVGVVSFTLPSANAQVAVRSRRAWY